MAKGIKETRAKSRSDFQRIHNSLTKRGFVALDALKPGLVRSLTLGDRAPSDKEAKDMAVGMGCGKLSNGPLSKVAWAFDSRDTQPTPVTGKDGKPLGLGYVKYGGDDLLPGQIYALTMASPYTAAPWRYLADLCTGLGVSYMYRFPDGTTCEFRDAGERLRQEMEDIEAEEQQQEQGGGDPSLLASILGSEPRKESNRLRRAREAYEDWQRTWHGYTAQDPDGLERHVPMAKEFLENNNLNLTFSQCMQEGEMYYNYFPTVGFERGRRGGWDPKIVRLGFLSIPHGGVRYEVMNEHRHIGHIYFGERFRAKISGEVNVVPANQQDVVMYPVAEATGRVAEWRYIVESNQRTRIKDRPTWVACPVYYGTRNYYQQPPWWSIFTSKAYDFSSTILYDKAKQRENNTSWGRIIYISLDYLDQVFADEGYQGNPDKQQEFIDNLEQQMENFLQQRDNHGKFMRQWMWTGPDGKEHKNVEIVNVADAVNDEVKAGKEELELSTNPIFLAFGVDPRDVGVPMVSASNGGTALREIRLMKQQLLHAHQRHFTQLLEDIARFNGFSERGFWAIRQMTFTTLDRSASGMVETVAGEGA